MELLGTIRQYSRYPISHSLMISLLKDYSQPNDKIHHLINEGILLPVKKGLYVAGPAIATTRPDPLVLANHILGPSYVSLASALSYYGLIPKWIFGVTSMTTKAARKFFTPVGLYSYTRLPLTYYSYGISSIEIKENRCLIASPEKALFDTIVTTAGVEFRSMNSAMTYLENDLRIDRKVLRGLNLADMNNWIPTARKKKSLLLLTQAIRWCR